MKSFFMQSHTNRQGTQTIDVSDRSTNLSPHPSVDILANPWGHRQAVPEGGAAQGINFKYEFDY